jgi:hypothetical protein
MRNTASLPGVKRTVWALIPSVTRRARPVAMMIFFMSVSVAFLFFLLI